MDKQAAIRRIRIAVSVFIGIMALALLVLWVPGYTRQQFVDALGGGD